MVEADVAILVMSLGWKALTSTFTFIKSADAFIQSNVQMSNIKSNLSNEHLNFWNEKLYLIKYSRCYK